MQQVIFLGLFQVASILRQAGQDSIRLVIARPVDPSSPQYGVRFFNIIDICCSLIFFRNNVRFNSTYVYSKISPM